MEHFFFLKLSDIFQLTIVFDLFVQPTMKCWAHFKLKVHFLLLSLHYKETSKGEILFLELGCGGECKGHVAPRTVGRGPGSDCDSLLKERL